MLWAGAAPAGTLYTTFVEDGAGFTSALAVIDPSDGSVSVVGSMGVEVQSLAYDPLDDILYAAGPTSADRISERALYVVDRSDGSVTRVGATGVSSAMAFDSLERVLYGTLRHNSGEGSLATIDRASGLATAVGPPVIEVSSLEYLPAHGVLVGINPISKDYGLFDPSDGSFTRLGEGPYFAFSLGYDSDSDRLFAATGSTLYELDPLTGASSIVTALTPANPYASMAVVPEPSALSIQACALLTLLHLARRRARR